MNSNLKSDGNIVFNIFIGAVKCVDVDQEYRQIKLHKSNAEPKIFTYDAVYDMLDNQRKLYDETAFPLVESVIEGYNGN
jgi:hypothetical protein